MPKKEDLLQKGKIVCASCGSIKTAASFFEVRNQTKHNLLPVCKNCCAEHYRLYVYQTGSDYGALWLICAEQTIPFYKELATEIIEQFSVPTRGVKKANAFTAYVNLFNEKGLNCTGFYDSDTMLWDYYDPYDNQKVKTQNEARLKGNINEEIKKWGKFQKGQQEWDLEAYEFLNYELESYTKDLGELDTNILNRYKDLCKAEWQLRKANESGVPGDIAKAQDMLNKQLTLLKLNNFDARMNDGMEQMLERQIWKIENTKPCECEDLNAYKDFSGFEKPFEEIMRCLRNLCAGTKEYPTLDKG